MPDETRQPENVTALLTVQKTDMLDAAQKAIQAFQDQIYPLKQLVVLNTTGSYLSPSQPDVIEYYLDAVDYTTRASMLNYGIRNAISNWYVLWDGHSHPYRLMMQMAYRKPNCVVMLNSQVLVGFEGESKAIISGRYNPAGIPSTMLFHADPILPQCFSESSETPELTLLSNWFPNDNQIISRTNETRFPGLVFHVAFQPESDSPDTFFDQSLRPKFTRRMLEYLQYVIALRYGLKVELPQGDLSHDGSVNSRT